MIKERMMRSLLSVIATMMMAAGVCLCLAVLPGTGVGGPQWQIVEYPPPTSLDPNEVITYEHANFVGRYIRFKLQPGMRQLLVSGLPEAFNDVISSIQVGSKVAVMVFEDADYYILYGSRVYGGRHAFPGFPDVFDNSKNVIPEDINDKITSLIVFPKELVQPLGVFIWDNHSTWVNTRFLPLPEFLDRTEAGYSALGGMDDDANEVILYPSDSKSPAFGKVQVTLYEHPDFKGKNITLPGADGAMHYSFKLGSYQFDDTASSLVVKWVAPSLSVALVPQFVLPPSKTAQAKLPPASASSKAKAPPASLLSTINNISGQWNSNIGAVYNIQQSGNQFTWSVPSLNQSGTGTISGNSITLSGPGWTVKGAITEADASGKPTKIVGENGVILFRTTGAPSTPPGGIINISGQWKSSVGLVYFITQSGDQFQWTVANINEQGQGTVKGNDISVSWKGQQGPGSAAGKITIDSSGKATEIKWSNGVRFFR